MSNRLLVLGLSLVVGTASAQRPADDPIQFVARCTFEQERDDPLSSSCEFELKFLDDGGAHGRAHGWYGDIDVPDLADFGRAAACPGWLLDRLAVTRLKPCRSQGTCFDRAIADVLARNGRVNEALRRLESDIDGVRLGTRYEPLPADMELANRVRFEAMRSTNDISFLSESAARIAARDGQWERALGYTEDWKPHVGCDSGHAGEVFMNRHFRERCLVAVGRYDECVALVRMHVHFVDPEQIALWIECSLATHRARDADGAFRAILSEVPESVHDMCRLGLRQWELEHMSREGQLACLDEVARFDPRKALALLLSSNSLEIVKRMNALEFVGRDFREPALAKVLAETGHPDLRPMLERASKRESMLILTLDNWELANARWNALAVVR
jgi:hypothetical protein